MPGVFPTRSALREPYFVAKETKGSPKFPSYPYKNMPCPKTPVVSQILAICAFVTAAFSVTGYDRLSPFSKERFILMDHNCNFRGSISRPAFLLPPAPDLPYGLCLWGSLQSCWLDFGLVGLGSCKPHPLDNNN